MHEAVLGALMQLRPHTRALRAPDSSPSSGPWCLHSLCTSEEHTETLRELALLETSVQGLKATCSPQNHSMLLAQV